VSQVLFEQSLDFKLFNFFEKKINQTLQFIIISTRKSIIKSNKSRKERNYPISERQKARGQLVELYAAQSGSHCGAGHAVGIINQENGVNEF
jgi:hypothetical protein